MKRLFLLLILSAGVLININAVTIKLGSIAPSGSPWDTALNRVAADWRRISGGRVILKIYSGGIVGDEANMLRNIRIGQLDAAALSTIGLNRISPDLLTLCLPFLYQSNEEVLYVLDKMRSEFEGLVEDKGFKMMGWSLSGWIKFFSINPVVYPADLQKQKLAVTKGDAVLQQAWKEMGFQVLPVDTMDLMSALQSRMIDAFYAPPIAAAAYQWFGLAKNMCSFPVSPLITGFVIGDRAWRKIPASLREELILAVEDSLGPLSDEIDVLDEKAIEIMTDNGLSINHTTNEANDLWASILTEGSAALIGKSISEEIFEKAQMHLRDFRNNNDN